MTDFTSMTAPWSRTPPTRMVAHRTASGGLVIEDGDRGACCAADGSAFTWGEGGDELLAPLREAALQSIEGSESWSFGLHVANPQRPQVNDNDDNDDASARHLIELSEGGLGQAAARMIAEDRGGASPSSTRPANPVADEVRHELGLTDDAPGPNRDADTTRRQLAPQPTQVSDQDLAATRQLVAEKPTSVIQREIDRLNSMKRTPERDAAIRQLRGMLPGGDRALDALRAATTPPAPPKPSETTRGARRPVPASLPAGQYERPQNMRELEEWSRPDQPPERRQVAARIMEAMKSAQAIAAPPSVRKRSGR
ncbi:MAG: hypothetical protein V7607_1216 [Solirubrobacteraceae bacterium]